MHTVHFSNPNPYGTHDTYVVGIGCITRAYNFARWLWTRYDNVVVHENEYPGFRTTDALNVIGRELGLYFSQERDPAQQ